jgi:hypothetical protein
MDGQRVGRQMTEADRADRDGVTPGAASSACSYRGGFSTGVLERGISNLLVFLGVVA